MNRGEFVDHEIGDETFPALVVNVDGDGVASALVFGYDGTATPVRIDPKETQAKQDAADAETAAQNDADELARFRREAAARNAAATPRDSEGVQQRENGEDANAGDPANTGDTRFGTPTQNPTFNNDNTGQSDKGLE